MERHSEPDNGRSILRDRIIGLGERSLRKSYYPLLQQQLTELEQNRVYLEEKSAALLNMLEDLEEARNNLAASQASYRALVENINDVIFSSDVKGRITYISPVIFNLSGYRAEQIIGQEFSKFIFDPDNPAVTYHFQDALNGERKPHEFRIKHMDGTLRFVRTSARPLVEDGQVVGITGVMVDISERKQAEEVQRRLDRELRAISSCNQTLLRAVDEQTLLNEICRIICSEAGYRMAWVGYAENDDEKTIRPMGWAGYDEGYIDAARLSWAENSEHGQGPAGNTVRNKETICIQDFATDPRMAPWRKSALDRGYNSCITLPLKDECEKVFGVLLIYASERNAFTPDEIQLIEELAGDLAFGIITLRNRAERKRVEESLEKSEHRLQLALQVGHIGVYEIGLDETMGTWTKEIEEIWGLPENFQGGISSIFWQFVYPADRELLKNKFAECVETLSAVEMEFRVIRPDSTVRWIHWRAKVSVDSGTGKLRLVGVSRDITEKKLAEEKIRLSEQRQTIMSQIANIFLSSPDEQIYSAVLTILRQIIDGSFGIFGYIDKSGDMLVPGHEEYKGLRCQIKGNTAFFPATSWKESIWGEAIRHRTAFYTDEPFLLLEKYRGGDWLGAIPIVYRNESIGLISIVKRQSGFTEHETALLESIAEYISPILKARLQRNWQEEERELAEEILRKSEDKFAKVFHVNPAATSITKINDGLIIDCNESLEKILGYSHAELVGHSAYELGVWCNSNDRRQMVQMLSKNIPVRNIETTLQAKDGRLVTVLNSMELIKIDDEPCVLSILLDKTEQKKAEDELEQYRLHLEELVKTRTDELFRANNQLNEQLEKEKSIELLLEQSLDKEKELSEMKSRFISTTSHEFRTPLASILSSAQLIHRYRTKWSDEKLDEHLNRVKQSVINLTKLLDDVLTISRAESGIIQFTPQETNLRQFCLEISEEVKHYINENHTFIFNYLPGETKFPVDPKLFRFILQNLLTNAFKYSPQGGKVELQVFLTKKQKLRITVSDEGIGIPEEDREHLFEPFHRAKNTMKITGTGLGLSIVKRSVDLHYGEIMYETAIGKGTKFTVLLPLDIINK